MQYRRLLYVLCVDSVLYVWIHAQQPCPKIGMLPDQNIGIPAHSNKERINTTADRGHEDPAHLQPNQEGERHDDGSEGSALVVGRIGEVEVKIGQECAEIGNEDTAHGQDWPDQTVVDQNIDTPIFHHLPCVFGSGDVGFPIERNVAKCVSIDESDCPIEQANETAKTAEHDSPDYVAVLCTLALSDAARLAQHIDDCHDERAETDTAK